MPKVEDIAQIANSSAQALGIAKYDIYGSSVDETDVDVFQGEPKQVQASNRSLFHSSACIISAITCSAYLKSQKRRTKLDCLIVQATALEVR